uniref:SFRICE_017045 n=1 Tax=Spodoptera frugiperda TaxID=7108 RepID=A0A2H1V9R7_SPOFR
MSETERLIELVKNRRFLYDLSDPLYKDRHKRMEAWKEISRLMGSGSGTAHIWSAKWKGLKDNYAKYKKTSEPGFVEAYKKYKHWPWADKVKFLDDCVSTTCRRVYNYTPKEIREPSPENTDPKTSEDNLNEGTSECEVKKDSLDGVDHFFLSYAETFKKLPPRMQIMLKLEIATLFTRYELQAEGMSKESIENMPRIVPHPVKYEFDFENDIMNE